MTDETPQPPAGTETAAAAEAPETGTAEVDSSATASEGSDGAAAPMDTSGDGEQPQQDAATEQQEQQPSEQEGGASAADDSAAPPAEEASAAAGDETAAVMNELFGEDDDAAAAAEDAGAGSESKADESEAGAKAESDGVEAMSDVQPSASGTAGGESSQSEREAPAPRAVAAGKPQSFHTPLLAPFPPDAQVQLATDSPCIAHSLYFCSLCSLPLCQQSTRFAVCHARSHRLSTLRNHLRARIANKLAVDAGEAAQRRLDRAARVRSRDLRGGGRTHCRRRGRERRGFAAAGRAAKDCALEHRERHPLALGQGRRWQTSGAYIACACSCSALLTRFSVLLLLCRVSLLA